MTDNFMGFGEIEDQALLKSGIEALAIGFPLDGPVHDATLLALTRMRHAHRVSAAYLEFLNAVQSRYPQEYSTLCEDFARSLTRRALEVTHVSALLTH